ncbi:Acylamino-acid-releasing enzyme, N-terminal domain [Dillenia turbinata]|uniref:acylaminoacyl-peptidase n=1 Tax=Dillenia turbinata TaxID=194707 RepID=A0AAN8Z7U1_9MAGN
MSRQFDKVRFVSSEDFTRMTRLMFLIMDNSGDGTVKSFPLGLDASTEEEYALLSMLLQEFTNISNIDRAWIFKSDNGNVSRAMFLVSQPNLWANKQQKYILSSHISYENKDSVSCQWAPFPVEITGASTIVPSPTGTKLLVIRNPENDSPTQFEIWGQSHLEKEFHIFQSVHGSVYTDGWFEGISWNSDETLVAYVAEEPSSTKPVFSDTGYKQGASADKDCKSWKAQGDWEEDWGETYAGKRQPALFVIDISSGDVRRVEGIGKSLSVGQVIWAPSRKGLLHYLVFVGWPSDKRKLGIKYCCNRRCALYAIRAPKFEASELQPKLDAEEDMALINLTQSISSAFIPRFSPDGKFLVFLSSKSAVDSGAHWATDSLHRIDWPADGKPNPTAKIVDVIPVVMCPDDGGFPGLYEPVFLNNPWLPDGCTMILSSSWGSTHVILSVNVFSGKVSRVSPADSGFSWNVLTLDRNNIIAVFSSPVDVPRIKFGFNGKEAGASLSWSWLDVLSPVPRCSEKVTSLLSSLQFNIVKIPVRTVSESLTKGGSRPFEAILVSSKKSMHDPLVVVLHGGPHSVSLTSFSHSLAFLSSIGYSLLIVNYRLLVYLSWCCFDTEINRFTSERDAPKGSLGFGEEALQSLPGKVGSQDVDDVLTAIDHVIDIGLADPSKIAAPEKFVAAAARNPVCNIALMIGTTDIPDWCYMVTCGSEGQSIFTEAASPEHLAIFYKKSPVSHVSKVAFYHLDRHFIKTIALLCKESLKEKGVPHKVIVFPNDVHAIKRPRSDFESFLNIGVWFNKTRLSTFLAMDNSGATPAKSLPLGIDASTEEEYASQSKLLQEFTNISNIDKAWTFKSGTGKGSQAMFLVSQPNLLANKRRKYILSSHISNENKDSLSFQWAPFPVEVTGASTIIPSPSGTKLLVIRNSENESPTQFEIWSNSHLEKEFHIPQSAHGSVYTDGWFEGISWNVDETHVAYVAEEPSPTKPTFGDTGYKQGSSSDKDCSSWKGQGDWEEDWGETYAGKRQPALFVIAINSGEVHMVEGIGKTLSAGQVVWAPSRNGLPQYLIFVGWPSDKRKLGIKYCYNRPCALYAIRVPFSNSEAGELQPKPDAEEDKALIKLTQSINSAFFPRFSPDGKFLVFLSAKSAVDSGAHCSTESLHKIDWPTDGEPCPSMNIVDLVPVVMCPEDGGFPGLYNSDVLKNPWLPDGCTMILSSIWGSTQAILSVNILSGKVSRLSPADSGFSWNVLALDQNNIIAVCSSPVDVPQIKYGFVGRETGAGVPWSWLEVSSPVPRCSEKVKSFLSSLQFSVLKIPVRNVSKNLTKGSVLDFFLLLCNIGASKPIEAIFVSSSSKKSPSVDPLIVMIHGGPHSATLTSFSKNLGFLSSIGYSLLMVNYRTYSRGSLGFGEEALQSLPTKIGSQDVEDVLTAVDYAIDKGLADPSKITVLGGSHGGFLSTHLIGQAPDKFVAAAVRNPVCNIALMVGTTDIPDWCYFETFGSEGQKIFSEAAPPEHLALFYNKSPISHLSKVKTPTLFLLGAQDLRVPVSNGLQLLKLLVFWAAFTHKTVEHNETSLLLVLQYVRALKEKGVPVKLIVFPKDVHGIDRPQSDFESFLNIGVWFKKYCK